MQAIAGIGWWLWLFAVPDARDWFFSDSLNRAALVAFALPDLAAFVGGSVVSAWLVVRESRWAPAAIWFTAGATVYAALYCVATTLLTGEGVWGAALMTPAAVATVVAGVCYRK